MATVATTVIERRGEIRRAAVIDGAPAHAVLRPGVPVILINITSRAALLESECRLRPGARTEMQLGTGRARISVRGQVARCYVSALAPLTYRGVLMFETAVNLADCGWDG